MVEILRIVQSDSLCTTQGGNFTNCTERLIYVQHRVAILRVTQSGNFTYKAVWHIYVYNLVAILRIREFYFYYMVVLLRVPQDVHFYV